MRDIFQSGILMLKLLSERGGGLRLEGLIDFVMVCSWDLEWGNIEGEAGVGVGGLIANVVAGVAVVTAVAFGALMSVNIVILCLMMLVWLFPF